MENEHVLCIPTACFIKVKSIIESTLSNNADSIVPAIIMGISPDLMYMERTKELEENDDILQLVVYIVLTDKDKMLSYIRNSKDGENRLRGKRACPGGHVNNDDCVKTEVFMSPLLENVTKFVDEPDKNDVDIMNKHLTEISGYFLSKFASIIKMAVLREFHEEIDYAGTLDHNQIKIAGFIYLPDSPVNKVHLGVAVHVLVDEWKFMEMKEKQEAEFMTMEETHEHDCESWLNYILETYYV